MVSFDVRLAARAIDVLSLVVALCVLRQGATQPAPESAGTDPLAQIADRVLEAQAEGGPYAKEQASSIPQVCAHRKTAKGTSRPAVVADDPFQ